VSFTAPLSYNQQDQQLSFLARSLQKLEHRRINRPRPSGRSPMTIRFNELQRSTVAFVSALFATAVLIAASAPPVVIA
jgi:hypothetical protein